MAAAGRGAPGAAGTGAPADTADTGAAADAGAGALAGAEAFICVPRRIASANSLTAPSIALRWVIVVACCALCSSLNWVSLRELSLE